MVKVLNQPSHVKPSHFNPKIKVLFFVSKKNYNFYFDNHKSSLDKIHWLPYQLLENFKIFLDYLQGIYILLWVWLFSFKKQYIIICCDNKRDAELFKELFDIDNVLFVSDIIIQRSLIGRLNLQYKNDLTFLHSAELNTINTMNSKLFKVDVSENTNIFLTMGEYDTITDFELALEAFYVLYTYKLKTNHLKKATYLVILGDEIEFKVAQENYFKKLEGFVYKHGLQRNVFFLRIFPYISKTVIMKVSLCVLFTNTRGCYQTNLLEAIRNSKNIIAPNSNFYRRKFSRLGVSPQSSLFDPNPEDYAKEMYRHIRNKVLFRFLARGMSINIKK